MLHTRIGIVEVWPQDQLRPGVVCNRCAVLLQVPFCYPSLEMVQSSYDMQRIGILNSGTATGRRKGRVKLLRGF